MVRTGRVRADTTVVPANVAYPTDSGLLAKAVRRIGANVKRIQAAGGAVRTKVRDRSRSAGTKAHGIAARLRSRAQSGGEEAKAGVQRITGELAALAESAIKDARKLLVNARRAVTRARAKAAEQAAAGIDDAAAGRRRGRLVRAVNDLKRLVEATERIIEQARQRIGGVMPDGATRVVSLHDTQARPIAKGRLGKPVEFGYKAQFADNDDGIVLDHNVELGNPPDAPQLAPAIDRIIERTGRAPRVVTADRGYGEAAVDQQLLDLGVRHRRHPPQGQARQGPQSGRTRQNVPASGEVADRLRGPGQQPQTPVRVGPHPDRFPGRCPDLGRAGRLHQQPDQDRHPHRPVGGTMTADPARAAAIYLWLVSALVSGGPPIGATRIWLARQRIRPAGGPVPGMLRITAMLAGLAVKAAAHARKVPVNSRQALRRASTVLTRWLVPTTITASPLVSGDATNAVLDPIATAIRSPVRPHRIERPRNPNPGPRAPNHGPQPGKSPARPRNREIKINNAT